MIADLFVHVRYKSQMRMQLVERRHMSAETYLTKQKRLHSGIKGYKKDNDCCTSISQKVLGKLKNDFLIDFRLIYEQNEIVHWQNHLTLLISVMTTILLH